MDKTDVKVQEAQSDTSSVITMKEYASSEYPSSEPPPAYMKHQSTSIRIARIAALTIICSAVILGGFILAASWIQANTARNLDLTLNQELFDEMHPSYEHLIANELLQEQENALAQEKAEEKEPKKEEERKNEEGLVPPPPPQQEEKQSLSLDDIAAMLMQKNMKKNVNCIVEKKRNEELVDHAPRALNLPFGLNITTPPRLQHLTGEQMVVICKGDEDDSEEKDEEQQQLQQMIFPLPAHLINQIQQVPQVIPIQHLLQQQQQAQQQQQPLVYQYPQVPQQVVYHQPQQQMVYQQPQMIYQQQPQPQQQVQQPQQMVYQQPQPQVFYPQPPQAQHRPEVMDMRQNLRPQLRIVPLREVRLNRDGVPMNNIVHNRMPVNPLAIQDVPLSEMPLTHMSMKTEQQEGPTPVHHLVPPQPQDMHTEDFNHEEPRFSQPLFREKVNQRIPSGFRPYPPRRPFPTEPRSEIREPRERFPFFAPPFAEFHRDNSAESRDMETPTPVEGRMLPFPTPEMRPPFPVNQDINDMREAEPEPRLIKLFPLERRPMPISHRIRFPDSEIQTERRVPIITEITKIIPIRLEKEENKENKIQIIPLNRDGALPEIRNIEEIDNKLEKLPERPFPIPINAILDMIFRGMRPLVNGRANPMPIDIKIERIENRPVEGITSRPIIEFLEKDQPPMVDDSEEEEDEEEMPQPAPSQPPQPSTLMLDDVKTEKAPETKEEASPVEAKVERVEILEKETDNSHAIAIPADAQDPEIFKLADGASQPEKDNDWQPRAFLPNGQGRGARVFPIPQEIREAEIFSVSDARAGKSMEIPMETSFSVEKPKEEQGEGEGRQARVMDFPVPVEGEMNLFPLSQGRAMKPLPSPQVQPQTFSVNDARSIRLLPVSDGAQEGVGNKPVNTAAPSQDDALRPHFVQPRSV